MNIWGEIAGGVGVRQKVPKVPAVKSIDFNKKATLCLSVTQKI